MDKNILVKNIFTQIYFEIIKIFGPFLVHYKIYLKNI